MFRSLHIAATGMAAQEARLDAISNNLANTSTVGYKKVRADFQDLMYQTLHAAGTQTSAQNVSPTGLQVGSGVRLVATSHQFLQGGIQNTGNSLDVAIEGSGFLVVQQPDGTMAYTRAGTLKSDPQGRLVTPEGMPLDPPISIPAEAISVSIGSEGTVSATLKGQQTPSQLGQLQLANFINPAGLNSIGHNLYTATAASGDPQVGNPGTDGRGLLLQGAVELSNVDVAEEMVSLIQAQRGYEVNTKVITAADSMLQSATNLR